MGHFFFMGVTHVYVYIYMQIALSRYDAKQHGNCNVEFRVWGLSLVVFQDLRFKASRFGWRACCFAASFVHSCCNPGVETFCMRFTDLSLVDAYAPLNA